MKTTVHMYDREGNLMPNMPPLLRWAGNLGARLTGIVRGIGNSQIRKGNAVSDKTIVTDTRKLLEKVQQIADERGIEAGKVLNMCVKAAELEANFNVRAWPYGDMQMMDFQPVGHRDNGDQD